MIWNVIRVCVKWGEGEGHREWSCRQSLHHLKLGIFSVCQTDKTSDTRTGLKKQIHRRNKPPPKKTESTTTNTCKQLLQKTKPKVTYNKQTYQLIKANLSNQPCWPVLLTRPLAQLSASNVSVIILLSSVRGLLRWHKETVYTTGRCKGQNIHWTFHGTIT